MGKKVTNEQIVAALMSHGTQKEAAAALGITERTIYDRMSEGDFKSLYKSAKADVVRKAVASLNNHIGEAIDTIVSIMNSEDANPAVRLQAAQSILNNAGKFAERLSEDENNVSIQKENSFFNDMFEF